MGYKKMQENNPSFNMKGSLNSINSNSSYGSEPNHDSPFKTRNSVLTRNPDELNRFRTDIEVKFSELRTKNATLTSELSTIRTEKDLKIRNLEDDLNLVKLQNENLSKDYNYLQSQNKDVNQRLTKVTEDRCITY